MTRIRLTDMQLVLLSAAAARPDLMLLPPPDSVRAKGKVLAKTLATLLARGLVEEVPARHDAEAWREAEDGARIGLRLAAAGRAALGLEGADESAEDVEPGQARCAAEPPEAMNEQPETGFAATAAVRPGTKQARLLELISAPEGARIDAIAETLGWQVHTARAAITGLRRKGFAVERAKGADGGTVYRLGASEAAADAA